MRIVKRRRREGKTDYKLRTGLLKSANPRILFRKTNRYVIGQCIESDNAQDKVLVGINSKDLLDFGWPAEKSGSLKSIPACYLSGLLLGKKVQKKVKSKAFIFDIGMLRNIKGSKIYSFLKGVIDSGLNIKAPEDIFPEEKKIAGENSKAKDIFNKVKEKINKE